ncbi:MAG: cyclase family protein [Anaerolineae bacterium]|jgi:kynurenine formamidase
MGYKLIDLSQEIYTGAPVWPGHPETKVTVVDTHEETVKSGRFTENYSYTAEKFEMSTHGTTHVDSISHIDPAPGAPAIDVIPLDWFYTRGICIDLTHVPARTEYTVETIKEALDKAGLEIKKGDTVLLYSGHYGRTWGTDAWLTDYPGLSREAAEYIYGAGAINIGQDAPSHDCAGTTSYPAHQVCREMQTLNIENLGDLSPVAGKTFQFIGLPLKIRNGSGSPIRAVAVLEDEDEE